MPDVKFVRIINPRPGFGEEGKGILLPSQEDLPKGKYRVAIQGEVRIYSRDDFVVIDETN